MLVAACAASGPRVDRHTPSVPSPLVTTILTPLQQDTLDLLGRPSTPVTFDADFVAELRDDADMGLAELAERMGDGAQDLTINKHGLERVLTCETMWSAGESFTWTPARARGAVAHRAIQLSVHWPGEQVPATLVDEALERLAGEERGIAAWLASLRAADAADLRGRAVELLSKFLECFPPLDGKWWPVTESTLQFPRDGRIVLRSRVDLTLGTARGGESRKVIIDVKTGRLSSRHREDLRFYALVETLSRRVPPRLLATYSLDSGSADREAVTDGVLRSALRRTLDAVERMVAIRFEGRDAGRTPGVACRWCPLSDDCDIGSRWLASTDRDLGDGTRS